MSYQVLYRAWRPATFSEVVGQDAIVQTLRRQVVTGHIAHAYLFCGTRGTGKTTASKILARAINCLNPRDGDPCGECEVCRAILSESCMDVSEIDAASNNGVDEIRDLRDKIQYPPSLTRYKVYIIDEVHMLSTGAFNALLKTLEEPPRHAVFILATTEPQKLPATILSRCQRFDFHRIAAATIVGRLHVVLNGIHREAEEEALFEIARAAEGGMRDALSLLDNCLSYTDGAVTLELVRDVLGSTGRGFLFDFADALIRFDSATALDMIEQMMNNGSDPVVFLRDITAHLRSLLLAPMAKDTAALLEIPQEDAERVNDQAKRVSAERVTRLMELFIRAESDMKWASRPRTVLELVTVKACHPEDEPDAGLMERMEKLEAMLASGTIPAAKKRAVPVSETPPAQSPPAAAPKRNAPSAPPPQEYLDAMERLMDENPPLRKMLAKAQFAGCDENGVTLEFEKSAKIVKIQLEKRRDILEAAFSDAFGRPMSAQLRMEGEGAPQTAAAGTLSPQVRKTIDQLYDIFPRDKISIED